MNITSVWVEQKSGTDVSNTGHQSDAQRSGR